VLSPKRHNQFQIKKIEGIPCVTSSFVWLDIIVDIKTANLLSCPGREVLIHG
jgi:hypothetical protein